MKIQVCRAQPRPGKTKWVICATGGDDLSVAYWGSDLSVAYWGSWPKGHHGRWLLHSLYAAHFTTKKEAQALAFSLAMKQL
jgi:hypothetical protein